MTREALRTGVRVGLSLLAVAAVAWRTGTPALFPSLGPSAYVLGAAGEDTPSPQTVLGGHAIGVVAGLVAFHGVGALAVAPAAPGVVFDPAWPVASGVLSVALTAGGMRAADVVHPPACATTLIVSLGLLSTLPQGVLVLASVALLLATDALVRRVDGRYRVRRG